MRKFSVLGIKNHRSAAVRGGGTGSASVKCILLKENETRCTKGNKKVSILRECLLVHGWEMPIFYFIFVTHMIHVQCTAGRGIVRGCKKTEKGIVRGGKKTRGNLSVLQILNIIITDIVTLQSNLNYTILLSIFQNAICLYLLGQHCLHLTFKAY